MQRVFKEKPPRLDLVFQRFDAPLYLITFNTYQRQRILMSIEVHAAFIDYCQEAAEFSIGVGRYVIMPDHIHLFVRFGLGCGVSLGNWIRGLKRNLDAALAREGQKPARIAGQKLSSFWQPGSFDHLLRSDESYAAKWDYVRQNPVRAVLVANADDWPYAGEIVRIDRV